MDERLAKYEADRLSRILRMPETEPFSTIKAILNEMTPNELIAVNGYIHEKLRLIYYGLSIRYGEQKTEHLLHNQDSVTRIED
jgi:hypothetical protein